MPETDDKTEDREYSTDLLYGVLSVLNQFGGVLRERGQEYRKSSVGKLVGAQIETMYLNINNRERTILDVVLISLDELASTIRNLDADLNGVNGGGDTKDGAKAAEANGDDTKKDRVKKTRPRSKPAQGRTTNQ